MSKFTEHEARINRVLAQAFQRETRVGNRTTAENEPMTHEEVSEPAHGDSEDIHRAQIEAVQRLLYYIFQDGVHPGCTIRRLYFIAQKMSPALVLHMSGSELAEMLGETRAAWSARVQRLFTGYLRSRGYKAVSGGHQKSETHALRCAEAARGNTNRRGKTKKKAA